MYVPTRHRDYRDMPSRRVAPEPKLVKPQPKRKPQQRIYLKEWRKFRNLTQEELASRIEVDRSYISMIERGASGYTQIFLEAAAEALGIEPADLLVRNPLDPQGYWSVWEGIPPADRPKFAQAIQALKSTLKTGT